MTDEQKQALHVDAEALLEALRDAGAVVKSRTRILCPFHEDSNPSATIYQGEGDVWRFKCMACGVCEDVIGVQALSQGRTAGQVLAGESVAAMPHPKLRTSKGSKPAAPARIFPTLVALTRSINHVATVHRYTHPLTKAVEMAVVRVEDGDHKRFLQVRPEGDGFVFGAPAAPLPIYNRGRVVAAATIIVVEGEKCVEALTRLGYVATTSPGGAENGGKADWSPLAGKADVVLWPDQDDPDPKKGDTRKGHRHMRQVADLLEQLDPPPSVRWFDPTPFDLPSGGDAVDYIAQHGGDDDVDRRRAVDCVIGLADPIGGASDLSRLLEDTISGKRSVIPLPWSNLDRLSQALMPGTITCGCGEPGCGKSYLILQAALYWHRENVKVAVYMLEEDRDYHLQRALAQLARNANLTSLRWIRENADATRAAEREHRAFLATFARCITTAPEKHVTLADLAVWVEARAKAGCEVIVIDPVTAADAGDKRHLEDMTFMWTVKATLRRYPSARVVLMTHPRTGAKGWGDMAGGAAYPRFAQSVFWIHAHQPPKQVLCETWSPVAGKQSVAAEVGRTIKLGKTRNGQGAGLDIGFEFDPGSLRFVEKGIVVKRDRPSPSPHRDPFGEQEA